jgi:hypothetical protein
MVKRKRGSGDSAVLSAVRHAAMIFAPRHFRGVQV